MNKDRWSRVTGLVLNVERKLPNSRLNRQATDLFSAEIVTANAWTQDVLVAAATSGENGGCFRETGNVPVVDVKLPNFLSNPKTEVKFIAVIAIAKTEKKTKFSFNLFTKNPPTGFLVCALVCVCCGLFLFPVMLEI